MSGIRITTAGVEDAELLSSLGRKAFLDAFAAENTLENMNIYLQQSFSPAKQRQEIQASGSEFFLLYQDDVLVGYARLLAGAPPTCVTGERPIELVRFYLLKYFIGQGLGAVLMQYCLDFATKKDHGVVWLGVWEHNQRAIAFYQKWGFAAVGTQAFRLGNDPQRDLVMQRALG